MSYTVQARKKRGWKPHHHRLYIYGTPHFEAFGAKELPTFAKDSFPGGGYIVPIPESLRRVGL
jgi:hypothetical protein